MTMQANARGSGQDASRKWCALREVLTAIGDPADPVSSQGSAISQPSCIRPDASFFALELSAQQTEMARLAAIERSFQKKKAIPK